MTMRVLFYSEAFWPAIGGIEVLAARLVEAMHLRGHDVVVVTSNTNVNAPERDEYQGVPIHRFPFWDALADRTLRSYVAVRSDLVGLLRDFRPDLVHMACIGPGTIFQTHAARATSAPMLLTFQQVTSSFETPGTARLLRDTLRNVSWVVFCSAAVRSEVRGKVPEVHFRSSVILNGVIPPSLEPGPLLLNPPRILCVARLAPEKGLDLALKAFASLGKRISCVELVIAGDGPLRGELEDLARTLGVRERVTFRGWVAPDAVWSELAQATLVLMPSREESFGLVALEAALAARPVVATRVGGLQELIQHGSTGLLVCPEDPEAIANAISHLLDCPELMARMGRAASIRARSAYSWERYLDGYEALYERLRKEALDAGSRYSGDAQRR
jgi:glycogen(starch) synthase